MLFQQPRGGWIELICGSMFSGKTEELIRRVRRAEIARQRVQVFKPNLDDRYAVTRVASHDGLQFEAVAIETAAEILEKGGALVTEYPYGTDAAQHQFVQRDRIQAGLSRGVVMIQSDLEGGSLHASRAALRYGRVLAVPRPTQADVDAAQPKITANLVLTDGAPEERMQLLQCHAAALNQLKIISSRDDYQTLERELGADDSRRPVE